MQLPRKDESGLPAYGTVSPGRSGLVAMKSGGLNKDDGWEWGSCRATVEQWWRELVKSSRVRLRGLDMVP